MHFCILFFVFVATLVLLGVDMKKTTIICVALLLILIVMGLAFSAQPQQQLQNADYLRIHIRANSNDVDDQNIKYTIKDAMVEFLAPKLAFCASKQQVVELINNNTQQLENLANCTLKAHGFDYVAKIKIDSEMFPTRTYEGYTLQSGVYDAIIVELGSAAGNNWWCVMYPPLCFVNYSAENSQNIVYKSKIWEIIKQFFD